MVELLVNLVEFHAHFSQCSNEFPLGVGGFSLCHGLSNTRSLKRMAEEGFGNRDDRTRHRQSCRGHGKAPMRNNAGEMILSSWSCASF